MDSFANVLNITFFIFVDGTCDIQTLRKRVSTNILSRDSTGKRPYGILLNSTVEKFGFPCMSDESGRIDFTHHVRLCPGIEDDRVYAEHEFLDIVAKLGDFKWKESRPKWEFLIAPHVKLEGSEESCSGIAVKFHHLYVDGISLAQFLRNCIFDQPVPKLILDPVNPPLPPSTIFSNVLLALQILLLGPYISLRLLGNDYDPILTEGPLNGGKLIGRTKMDISLEMMRRIRKFHNCTTQTVLHSAFIGSLQKMAKRKGVKLPDEILAGVVFADFPYPDEFPRNNGCLGCEPVAINDSNLGDRLAKLNKSMVTLYRRKYDLKACLILQALLGMYPAALIKFCSHLFKTSYYISNVPGLDEAAKIEGNAVQLIFGIGPLFNRIRYQAGVGFYGGSFSISLYIESSKLISNRNEMENWILEFENEIRCLDKFTKAL
ncbi:unnamed protein product [Orchesella dallaii]|uniref:O-acyltransferase WSD1 C-terminal domain-containing protein n=1 Tax=Orchesella dallaii TaxID=48710 RepID=A0ABP1S8Z5_9HEXA